MTASASSVKRLTRVSKQRTPALLPWSHPSANTSARATRKNSAGRRNDLGAEAPPALYPGDYDFWHNPALLPKANRRNRCSPRSSAVPARNCWGGSDSCSGANSGLMLPRILSTDHAGVVFGRAPSDRARRTPQVSVSKVRDFEPRQVPPILRSRHRAPGRTLERNGISGEEFEAPDHIYVADLNLFGNGSLFECLCIARTHLGCERLAHYLQISAGIGEIRQRQAAVRELAGCGELRERLAQLGR
jgi:hypothetical protein